MSLKTRVRKLEKESVTTKQELIVYLTKEEANSHEAKNSLPIVIVIGSADEKI